MARTIFSIGLLKLAGIKLKVKGVENIDKSKTAIYVANHSSHLDIGCLCRAIPVNLHFIGKKELKWVPFVGWYMFITGHIFIDRSNKKKAIASLKKAALKIKKGKNVVMYPEGTRTRNGEVQAFKKGAFYLALVAGVPIIPVSIKGTYNVWPAGTSKITPGPVTISIGKPIDSSIYTKETVKAFMEDTRNAVVDGLMGYE